MKTVSRNILFFLVILFLAFNATVTAQDESPSSFGRETSVIATAAVDKTEVNIGDKIKYTIKVEYAPGIGVTFPEFGELLAGFTIKDYGTSNPKNMHNNRIVQEQWYILDTYIVGSYTIPSATIKYTDPEGGEKEVKVPEVNIEVKSVIKEGEDASDIKDIKPPVNIPVSYRKLYLWGGIPLGILACGGAVSWFLLRRRQKGPASEVIKRSPHEIAYEALNALSKSDLIARGQVKEYYFSLSDIVRRYIENRFQLMAPERTTEEFLKEMSNANILIGKHKQLIKSFLGHCDLVKFAKYNPESQEIKDAFDAAVRLIDDTKETFVESERKEGRQLAIK